MEEKVSHYIDLCGFLLLVALFVSILLLQADATRSYDLTASHAVLLPDVSAAEWADGGRWWSGTETVVCRDEPSLWAPEGGNEWCLCCCSRRVLLRVLCSWNAWGADEMCQMGILSSNHPCCFRPLSPVTPPAASPISLSLLML